MMTQKERRLWLINYLVDELSPSEKSRVGQIPSDAEGQKYLLRGLMNVRPAAPVTDDFLKIQDEYLAERKIEKGINVPELSESISIWRGDITTLEVDAIVNAANSALTGCYGWNHSCIDNAIHTFAGVQLRLECHRLMKEQGHEEETGLAKITPAYNLPCKYVLHTVGPVVSGSLTVQHKILLANCYKNCLALAVKNGCKSIAFCCISTGVFNFPSRQAARIAVKTVQDFLEETKNSIKIVFNVFSGKDEEIYKEILDPLR